MNKKLAKITGAKLEIKERGILNFWIYVDYEESGSQGIGGIALDEWDEAKKRRVGTAYGCEMIRRLLEVLDVNDFSEMKDRMIWVHGEGEGLRFKPTGIEPLKVSGLKKEPLIFQDVFNEFELKNQTT
jgi:hypothetical protein